MELMPWNPFRELEQVRRHFFVDPFGIFTAGMGVPRVDVYQTENEVKVVAELPGISKEDVTLFVDENSVRLSGESKRIEEYREEEAYRTERFYGRFSRVIPLPVKVKYEEARADFRDGVLTVTIPKREPGRLPGRKIDIH